MTTKTIRTLLVGSLLAFAGACAAPVGEQAASLCTDDAIEAWDRCGPPPAACDVVDVMLHDHRLTPETRDPSEVIAQLEALWPADEEPAIFAGLGLSREEYLRAVDLVGARAAHGPLPEVAGADVCPASAALSVDSGDGPVIAGSQCTELRSIFEILEVLLCELLRRATLCERFGCDEETESRLAEDLLAVNGALTELRTEATRNRCTFSTTISCGGGR